MFPSYEKEKLNQKDFQHMMKCASKVNRELQLLDYDFGLNFGRKVLEYSSNLLHINFYHEERKANEIRWNLRELEKRNNPIKPLSEYSNYIYILLCYIYNKLLIEIYLQIKYNRKWFQLKSYTFGCNNGIDIWQVDNSSTSCQIKSSEKDEKFIQFKDEYFHAYNNSKYFGSTYINFNFAYEFLYCFVAILFFYTYFVTLYYNYNVSFQDVSLVRMILGIQSEQKYNFELVRNQVNSYIHSTCLFAQINCSKYLLCDFNLTRTRLMNCNNMLKMQNQAKKKSMNLSKASMEREEAKKIIDQSDEVFYKLMLNRYDRVLTRCNCTIELVKQLALTGRLHPLNKTRQNIEDNFRRYFGISIALLILGLIVMIAFCYLFPFVPIFKGQKFELDPKDLLWLIEFSIGVLLFGQVAILGILYAMVTYLDQTRYVNKVIGIVIETKEKLATFIRKLLIFQENNIESNFNNLLEQNKTIINFNDSVHINDNENDCLLDDFEVREALIYTLIHYRHFVHQFKLTKDIITISSIMIFVCVVEPTLYSHYLSIYLEPQMRAILALFSFIFSLFADLLFIPMCHFNTRCMALHRALTGLLAQAIQVYDMEKRLKFALEKQKLNKLCLNFGQESLLYLPDNHLVWFIQKELNNRQSIDQFDVRAYGIPIKYNTVLKVHFWLSILILPTVVFNSPQTNLVKLFGLT